MRTIAASLLLCLLVGCQQAAPEKDLTKAIPGEWLILYPDHKLRNSLQREIYGNAQDSIVGLLGLKTVKFAEDRSFMQTDSIHAAARGQWSFETSGQLLLIDGGGKGFDGFKGVVKGLKHDTLLIEENLVLAGENIRVIWHLKRIEERKRLEGLMSPQANSWRNAALSPVERLKMMLNYYSLYFDMVSHESIYFLASRVPLPLNYYQHAVGLKEFDAKSWFATFFADDTEARDAYNLLSEAFKNAGKKPYPKGDNYVIEYSMFLKRVAGEL